MKITRRDLKVILLLVGILSAFLVFQFYFRDKLDSIAAEEQKQEKLQKEIDELTEKEKLRPVYVKQMVEWEENIALKLKEFPVDQWYEDGILYLHEVENTFDVYFDTYTVEEAQEITRVTGAINGKEQTTALLFSSTSSTYSTNYLDMKNLINYIYQDKDAKRVINSVQMAFNKEAGKLTGNITFGAYAMIGGDRQYEEVVVPGYEEVYESDFVPSTNPDTGKYDGIIGVDNIFGETEAETTEESTEQ